MEWSQEHLDKVVASFPVTCTQCNAINQSSSKFCEKCAAPLKDYEFDLLHAPALRDARKWIGGVAILYLVGGVLMSALTWREDTETAIGILIINAALAGTQGGLWWWAKRATFAAAVASLSLYLLVIAVDAVADPMSLMRGWLIKIMFVTVLIKAIKSGLTVKRARQEAQALAASRKAAA